MCNNKREYSFQELGTARQRGSIGTHPCALETDRLYLKRPVMSVARPGISGINYFGTCLNSTFRCTAKNLTGMFACLNDNHVLLHCC